MDIKQYKSRYQILDDKKKLEYATASAARLSWPDLMEVLEDYLYISRKRKHNPLALFKLQLILLQEIMTVEYVLKEYRRKINEFKNQLSPPNTSEEERQAVIDDAEHEVFFHEHFAKTYREIADGIAWRTLGFNRALFSHMVARPSPGPISREGLESELMELAKTFEVQEGIAILNDITNFLRVGDVTILKDDGTLEFVEVKSKRPRGGARFSRQKERLQQAVEFFSTGEMPFKDETLVIDEFDIKPENYLSNVLNLIRDAIRNGAAIGQIGEHLLVQCIDFRTENEEKIAIVDAKMESTLERWREDHLVALLSLDKFKFGRAYAPYSVFPFPEDICIALMTGTLVLFVTVNVTQVMKYFEGRGWKITKGPEEHVEEATILEEIYTMTVSKGAFYMKVPPTLIGRLGFEFLRPKVLLQLFEEYYKLGPRQSSYTFSNFTGERNVWK